MNSLAMADKKREDEEAVVSRGLERAMRCVDFTGAREHVSLLCAATVAGIFLPPSDITKGLPFIRERIRRACFKYTDIRAKRAFVSRLRKGMDYYTALARSHATREEEISKENGRLHHHCNAFFLRVCAEQKLPLRVLEISHRRRGTDHERYKDSGIVVHDKTEEWACVTKCQDDNHFTGCVITRTPALKNNQQQQPTAMMQYHVDTLVVRDLFGDPYPWVCNIGGDSAALLPKDAMLDYYAVSKEIEAFQLCLWVLGHTPEATLERGRRVLLDRNAVKMIETSLIEMWKTPIQAKIREKKTDYYAPLPQCDSKLPWMLDEDRETERFFRTVRHEHPEIPNPPKPRAFAPPPNQALDIPSTHNEHANKRPRLAPPATAVAPVSANRFNDNYDEDSFAVKLPDFGDDDPEGDDLEEDEEDEEDDPEGDEEDDEDDEDDD